MGDTYQNDPFLPKTESLLIDKEATDDFSKEKKVEIKPRKRRNSLPEIDEKLKDLHSKLKDGRIAMIHSSEKWDTGIPNYFSVRRSKFIGVSRNGKNWQVLINVGDMKKYIGTYSSQHKAAIAYDFYSIALHGTKAKTNFSYSGQQLLILVEKFMETKEIPFDIFQN